MFFYPSTTHQSIDRISQGFLVSSALALLGLYCFLSVMVGNIYLLIVIQIFLGWSFGFVFSIATSESFQKFIYNHDLTKGLKLSRIIMFNH